MDLSRFCSSKNTLSAYVSGRTSSTAHSRALGGGVGEDFRSRVVGSGDRSAVDGDRVGADGQAEWVGRIGDRRIAGGVHLRHTICYSLQP